MSVKIGIILVLNFYSLKIVTKGMLVLMIITGYGILALIIKPYRDMDINNIDMQSTIVCAITVLLGLFIYNNEFEYFVYPSFALMIIVNLVFFVSIVKKAI